MRSMSCLIFSPDTTVPEALHTARTVSGVFNAHRTACVGCPLDRFCTLGDVARAYGLSQEAFLEELQQAALADPYDLTGAQCDKTD